MSDETRTGLIILASVLLACGVGLAAFALVALDPSSPGERAAQIQALAAAAGLVASVVLIVITAQYVMLTGDIAEESRLSRLDAVRPHFALRVDPLGPAHVVFTLVNAGRGSALDVDVTVTYHSIHPGGHSHSRRWRAPSMAPGAHAQFMPLDAQGKTELSTTAVVQTFGRVTVEGTASDVTGWQHNVFTVLDDLPGWEALLAASHQRYEEDHIKRLADESKKIREVLTKGLRQRS